MSVCNLDMEEQQPLVCQSSGLSLRHLNSVIFLIILLAELLML